MKVHPSSISGPNNGTCDTQVNPELSRYLKLPLRAANHAPSAIVTTNITTTNELMEKNPAR